MLVEVFGVRAGVQVSQKELYTHIHLNYVRVEFQSCIKKKKKKDCPCKASFYKTSKSLGTAIYYPKFFH